MSIEIQREAQARCRRDGGQLDTVILPGELPGGEPWWYIGSPYDALNVAKDIVFNAGADCGVRIETGDGRILTGSDIEKARY